MADTPEHETVVVNSGGGGGGAAVAIVVILILGVLAFLYFGGYFNHWFGGGNVNVNVSLPKV